MTETNISTGQTEFAGLQPVSYSKLPWVEKLKIVWGWFWRSTLMVIVMIIAAPIMLTVSKGNVSAGTGELDPRITLVIFLVLAIPFCMLTTNSLIHWILSSRIGKYRIIICKKRDDREAKADLAQERGIGIV